MHAKHEQILKRVAETTFGHMAFMLRCEDAPCLDEASCLADITFSGPFEGALVMSVPQSMLPILATNIMGLENAEASSLEDQRDALKEVLNVICGNLLPLIATPKDVFHVHPPRILSTDEPTAHPAADHADVEVSLRLDCGRVRLSLCLNNRARVVKS